MEIISHASLWNGAGVSESGEREWMVLRHWLWWWMKGHVPRNVGDCQDLEDTGKWTFLQGLQKKRSLLTLCSPVRLILELWPPKLWNDNFLSQICANLLHQQQETNTLGYISNKTFTPTFRADLHHRMSRYNPIYQDLHPENTYEVASPSMGKCDNS